MRPFVDQYLAGRTPIACTNCNTDVKFEPLLRMARQIGAERLATGHYARIRRNEQTGRYELLRARDETKDQSYFLWGLTQEQLSRSEFPLGELTKEEVRALARRVNLPVAEKPESMELCFVPNGNYVQFIQAIHTNAAISLQNGEGEIVTEDGDCHRPPHRRAQLHHRPAQRPGLCRWQTRSTFSPSIPERIASSSAKTKPCAQRSFEVEDVNWVSIAAPAAPLRAASENPPQARTRARHRRSAARQFRAHHF